MNIETNHYGQFRRGLFQTRARDMACYCHSFIGQTVADKLGSHGFTASHDAGDFSEQDQIWCFGVRMKFSRGVTTIYIDMEAAIASNKESIVNYCFFHGDRFIVEGTLELDLEAVLTKLVDYICGQFGRRGRFS